MLNRTVDAGLIEQRLLELAYTTEIKLTAPALAYYARCSIDDAAAVLDRLTSRDRLQMDVEDDGTIVYRLLGREALPRPMAPAAPIGGPAPIGWPPAVHARPSVVHAHPQASPLLAAILTVFVPGAGHLYAGRVFAAVMWFFVVSAGYALILPGLVFHLFNIASAASAARRLNAQIAPRQLAAGL